MGLRCLDQLLWSDQIPNNDKEKSLSELANRNSNEQLKEQTVFIRSYINEKSENQ